MDKALQKLKVKFTIDLHPSKLYSVEKGVREHLNGLLLRYNEDFDGVMLSYSNEKMLTHRAQIQPYFPLVRVEVAADIVLFKPRVGMRLVGAVNKTGADYISLLVLGFVNAAIGAERIRQDIQCRVAESCWASVSNPEHVIKVGTQVYFTVSEIQHPGEFVSLMGELRGRDTGAKGYTLPPRCPAAQANGRVDAAARAGPGTEKKKKNGKKRKSEERTPAVASKPVAATMEETKRKKRKNL